MSVAEALSLIQEIGIMRLSGTDGCMCMHCHVQGVHVDIACRKSSDSTVRKWLPDFYGTIVRVYSSDPDAQDSDLQMVAEEVVRQINDEVGHLPVVVRFCDYNTDEKMICDYCHAPRPLGPREYCEKHVTEDSRRL